MIVIVLFDRLIRNFQQNLQQANKPADEVKDIWREPILRHGYPPNQMTLNAEALFQ